VIVGCAEPLIQIANKVQEELERQESFGRTRTGPLSSAAK
jgi:hypothetical protein